MKHTAILLGGALCLSGCSLMPFGNSSKVDPLYGASTADLKDGSKSPENKIAIDFDTGIEVSVRGNFLDGKDIGAGGTQQRVSFRDAFKPTLKSSVGVSYQVDPNTTLNLRGFIKRAEARSNPVTVAVDATGAQTRGSFSDYLSYGAEVGGRKYVPSSIDGLRSYFGVMAGFAHVENVNAQGFAGNRTLFDRGLVPVASTVTGIEYSTAVNSSIALESGLQWEGEQNWNGSSGFSTGGDRILLATAIRGSFRF